MPGGFPGFARDLVTAVGGAMSAAFLMRWILSIRSWTRESSFFRALELLAEPFQIPLRRHLPRTGIDFSAPLAALLAGAATVFLRILLTRGQP